MPRLSLLLACLLSSVALAFPAAAEITLEETPQGVTVKADGKPFTDYLIKFSTKPITKPILWPVYGPTGQRMTRDWPMEPAMAGEKTDHVHQQSLWFTHGNVNGVDFWSPLQGRIEHKEFVKVASGPQGVLITRNDWLSPKGDKLICQDERTLGFGADENKRWIDFEIVLKATNGPVTFGDTKEGSFGVRMASPIAVDSKKGGQIVNSEAQTNGAAWGKPAAWVDYHGPVGDETLGLAILNHPSSFRFPTYWHVRTYGLFAANPFGLKDFTAGKEKGEYVLPAGESMKLRYRVLLHKGDEKIGGVAEAFAEFAK